MTKWKYLGLSETHHRIYHIHAFTLCYHLLLFHYSGLFSYYSSCVILFYFSPKILWLTEPPCEAGNPAFGI